jgi:hypothetical protein
MLAEEKAEGRAEETAEWVAHTEPISRFWADGKLPGRG